MAIAESPTAWRRSVPALLLVAYLLTMPIQIDIGGNRQLAPADAFILGYLLVRLPRMRHVPRAWTTWQLALVPLFGLGLMVALVRTGEITSYALLQKGVGLVALLVTFACFVDFMRSWDRVRFVLGALLAAVLLHATVALGAQLLVLAGGPVLPLINQPWPGERISGLVLDANSFGGLVGLGLMLHHFTARTPAALLRGWWAAAAYVILPATLLLTFSRSSWIGLSAGLLAAAVVAPRIGGRTLLGALTAGVALVPVVLTQVPNALDLVTRPSEIASRVLIGEEAITEFVASPLFGIGLGVYIEHYKIVVHNTALWFLSDLGVVGLAVFVGLVVSVIARLLIARRDVPAGLRALPLALLCAHSVMLGVSVGIEAFYQRHWWVVMAAAGAVFALSRPVASRLPQPPHNRPVSLAERKR